MSPELEYLRNLIQDAKSDTSITILRKVLKIAIEEAPPRDVIWLAELLLRFGVEMECSENN